MVQQTLFEECPLCNQGAVVWRDSDAVYRCEHCNLTLKERRLLGLFKKGHFSVSHLGEGDYTLAGQSLRRIALLPDSLKVMIGNVYTDQKLAKLAGGSLEVIRPVRTILAQIILEQLDEVKLKREMAKLNDLYPETLVEVGKMIVMDFSSPVSFRVPINKITNGMVLLEDVKGKDGRPLLKKNTVLSTNLIRILRSHHERSNIKNTVLVTSSEHVKGNGNGKK